MNYSNYSQYEEQYRAIAKDGLRALRTGDTGAPVAEALSWIHAVLGLRGNINTSSHGSW